MKEKFLRRALINNPGCKEKNSFKCLARNSIWTRGLFFKERTKVSNSSMVKEEMSSTSLKSTCRRIECPGNKTVTILSMVAPFLWKVT
ncbi:hypothetical protein J6590_064444 [Homalodisca vitripennis]|nr:hypothetical protein J6590_064444 [Homalodisca vitripennis]